MSDAVPTLLNVSEHTLVARDFVFDCGAVLPTLNLFYRTMGTPRRDAQGRIVNAVLLLHSTTVSGEQYFAPNIAGELFGPGQPLDLTRHYIILPDAIGHGRSSKPSDGLRARFPRYGYNDMVRAQHMVVTQALGIERLQLVMGISMGGMHTWVWGTRYPDMMRALFPLTSHPVTIAGRNMMWRHMLLEAIRNDPGWQGGDYETPPTQWIRVMPIFRMLLESPRTLLAEAPDRAGVAAMYERAMERGRNSDANDMLYAFESSFDYNPEPELHKIRARLVSLNFSDDIILCEELGVMQRAMAKIADGRAVLVEPGPDTNGHQSQAKPAVWKAHLAELLDSLN